ncbi:MAG: hypothetical protein DSM106950_17855 [Stigonema ocellatum SAG 48.90 = DSM 106950]|nr:hypothetical protein [Stigonema ocellatum SAG 48.90 = DSM 106950]
MGSFYHEQLTGLDITPVPLEEIDQQHHLFMGFPTYHLLPTPYRHEVAS